jgi:hypothetical protein
MPSTIVKRPINLVLSFTGPQPAAGGDWEVLDPERNC